MIITLFIIFFIIAVNITAYFNKPKRVYKYDCQELSKFREKLENSSEITVNPLQDILNNK